MGSHLRLRWLDKALFVSVPLMIAAGATWAYTHLKWPDFALNADPASAEATLVPGGYPLPPGCPVHSGELVVYWGATSTVAPKQSMAVLTMGRDTMLRVDRDPSGKRAIVSSLRLLDVLGHPIATIENNKMWVASGYRETRPDASTLVIYDSEDYEILRLSYLTENAISITATFRHPGMPPVVASNRGLQIGPLGYDPNVCMADGLLTYSSDSGDIAFHL
jgi:hypothetical protein